MARNRALMAGVLGGLIHFLLIGGLYIYLHGPELFGYSTASDSIGLFEPIHLYIVIGAFMLGAIPAVLMVERRLVTPALTLIVIVAGILLTSPRGLEPTPRDVGASNFAFYFALWFVPLIIACFIGGIEFLARYIKRVENDNHTR